MPKIEKLTAVNTNNSISSPVSIQIKLDNGLVVHSTVPEETVSTHPKTAKAMEIINAIISPIFEGLNPLHQKELDKMVTDLAALHVQHDLHVNISLGVSLCILKAAAALHHEDTVDYIRRVYDFTATATKPVLVLSLFPTVPNDGGFKEFFLIPARHFTVTESCTLLRDISSKILSERSLPAHANTELMNTVVLEIMQNKITESAYALHKDLYIGINPSLPKNDDHHYICNDMVAPVTAEDLRIYFQEVQTLYAPLILETPLQEDNQKFLYSLHQDIGDKTIITDSTDHLSTPAKCKKYATSIPNAMLDLSAVSITSVTHAIEIIQTAQTNDLKIMIDITSRGESNLLSALAFACNADFIKINSCDSDNEKELVYVSKTD